MFAPLSTLSKQSWLLDVKRIAVVSVHSQHRLQESAKYRDLSCGDGVNQQCVNLKDEEENVWYMEKCRKIMMMSVCGCDCNLETALTEISDGIYE